MQYLNLGLPRSGLQSIALAASMLGVSTRPKRPFTHRDWLDRIKETELLQGHPFSAHAEQVIATLQSLFIPYRLFCTLRPRDDWHRSCEQHFRIPSPDPWENQSRLLWFDSMTYNQEKFDQAYENRKNLADRVDAPLLYMRGSDADKWRAFRHILQRDEPPFPHTNKTRITPSPAYQHGELVA